MDRVLENFWKMVNEYASPGRKHTISTEDQPIRLCMLFAKRRIVVKDYFLLKDLQSLNKTTS